MPKIDLAVEQKEIEQLQKIDELVKSLIEEQNKEMQEGQDGGELDMNIENREMEQLKQIQSILNEIISEQEKEMGGESETRNPVVKGSKPSFADKLAEKMQGGGMGDMGAMMGEEK